MLFENLFARAATVLPATTAFAAARRIVALLLPALVATVATAQCTTTWRPTDTGPGCDSNGVPGIATSTVLRDHDGLSSTPGRLVFGGTFARLGIHAENIVELDPTTKTWSTIGGGLPGRVYKVLPMRNGDLVAQNWQSPIQGIVRFDGTSWQQIRPDMGYDIEEMLNGDVIASGGNRVRRFNGTSWVPLGSVLNSTQELVVRANGNVVVVDLTSPGFQLLEFDGTDWTQISRIGLAGAPSRFAVTPSGALVGIVGAGVVRETATGWVQLGSATFGSSGGTIKDLTVLPSGDIVIVGQFTAVGGVSASGIAKFDGTSWSAFATGFRNDCDSVCHFDNGRIAALATLTTDPIGAKTAWLQDGTSWHAPVRGVFEIHSLLELRSGELLGLAGAGIGAFSQGVAKFDGTDWRALPTSYGGGASCMLELSDGSIAIGGTTPVFGGMTTQGIGRLAGFTWIAMGSGLAGHVNALAELRNGDVIAGGDFSATGTQVPVNAISRFDGTSWQPLGLGLRRSNGTAGSVDDMVVMPNGHLVVAGDFTSAGGVPASNVAAFDGSAWRQVGAGIAVIHQVRDWSLKVDSNGVLTVLDSDRQVHRLLDFGKPTEQWSTISTTALGGAPESLVVLPDGDILASGSFFFTTPFSPAVPFARHDGTTWTPIPAWNVFSAAPPPRLDSVGLSGTVFALGDVYTGPALATTGWSTFTSDCPASATSFGAGCVGPLEARSLGWIGGTFRSRLAVGTGSLVVALVGFSDIVPGVDLSTVLPAPPGCTLDITNDFELLLAASDNSVEFALPMPTAPALVGAELFHQMMVIALDAQLALTSVVTTNALRFQLGIL